MSKLSPLGRGILPFLNHVIVGHVDRLSITNMWGLDWSLPGQGKPYSDCGKFGLRGCLERDDHHAKIVKVDGELRFLPEGGVWVQKYRRNCGRASCPVCYESWAGREAHSIVHRLEKWEEQHFEEKRYHLKPIHVVLSPPDLHREIVFESLRSAAYNIADWSGIVGGVMIFHPFRRKCRVCGHKPIPNNEDPVCPVCGSSSLIWYFSPHFHILGFGWIKDVEEIQEKTGWIVKNLGVRESVGGTALYQLSHAGIHKKYSSATWFGSLSYSEFWCPDPEIYSEKCPYCGRSPRPVKTKNGVDPLPGEEGDYFLISDQWIYSDILIVFGVVPDEFIKNPSLDNGSPNWKALFLTDK